MEIYYIGVDGVQAISSTETKRQIKEVMQFECAFLRDGKKVTWEDLYNPNDPNSLFQRVIDDKIERVDKEEFLTSRPKFCVISVVENRAVRLEYYEGPLIYDFRTEEIRKKELPQFMMGGYTFNLTRYLDSVKTYKDLIEYE